MSIQPPVMVLTGASGAGKTTLCANAVAALQARNVDVAGLLTLPRYSGADKVGMDVCDIRSGEQQPLGERTPVGSGPWTETWHFHASGLEWGAQALARAVPCEVLVVDELGPLELGRGEGWTIALDLLRGRRYRWAVIVVRPELLDALQVPLKGIPWELWTVTRANQDALVRQICDRVGGQYD